MDAAPKLPACDYIEAGDTTNDTTAENTSLTIGDKTRDICGSINTGHYNATTQAVDVDTYQVTVDASSADLLVDFFGGPGVETLSEFSVLIFDTQTPNPTLINGGLFDHTKSDHGVFISTLPAGTYNIVVTGKAPADLSASFDYKVRVNIDDRTKRCALPVAMMGKTAPAPDYMESHDTASNTGNDVYSVNFATNPQFGSIASSSPEPTNLTIDAGKGFHIAGSAAAVTNTDQYQDRDTYKITSGAKSNELAVRLDWTGGAADLDYVLFADGTMTSIGSSTTPGTSGEEFVNIAVEPNTAYDLWIGATKASTGLPATYDVEVCGDDVSTDVSQM
ncbi:MAG TPA: hypothetical protein VLX92_14315 [Kofleriaceae bacterium]|nr:hypothetical protein [Kofleriaceae bacterium]